MKTLTQVVCGLLLSIFSLNAYALDAVQNIRGRVVDVDSKQELIGVNVYIKDSEPLVGTVTNMKGQFTLTNLPVGRYHVAIAYLGYESRVVPNVLLGAGKEVFLNVELAESLTQLDEVVVTANKNKGDALNEMAVVSARSFTVEETKRYAGTFNDPARMVSSYAGVVSNPSGNNDIIVRGNSPKGILWRLEGIEIPNPNHFASEGGSGGPINALNSAMLDNSDFFTGAFAPEYGNAYSGVFDMKLRTGNNRKREYSLSAGALGFDGSIEGPFKEGYDGSYLINYRYSSLALLTDIGVVDFDGVPKYQDLSFKFYLPAGKLGTFSIFGLGGKSNIYIENMHQVKTDSIMSKGDLKAQLGTIGLTHIIPFGEKAFLKTTLSAQNSGSGIEFYARYDNGVFYNNYNEDFDNNALKTATCLNYKLNSQHRFKAGLTYTELSYNVFSDDDLNGTGSLTTNLNSKGYAGLIQAYLNWKYRITQDLTFVSGAHYMNFTYNNSISLEPRLAMQFALNDKSAVNLGFGMHSKIESLATYSSIIRDDEGVATMPNTELKPNRALHYVVGYQHQFSRNLRFNGELYYQQLLDVPVENNVNSPYVFANESEGWTDVALVNDGTGKNYGVELTLERFYANQFYFLATTSLYQSKFTAKDGIERNTRFNGNFTTNFLVGKEFNIGNESKHRTLALNAKVLFYGAGYATPIDLDASREQNTTVYDMSKYKTLRADNVFKTDFAISYRRDRDKTTHEFKIDVQNITNNQAVIGYYFDMDTQNIETATQWSVFPNVIYTIQF